MSSRKFIRAVLVIWLPIYEISYLPRLRNQQLLIHFKKNMSIRKVGFCFTQMSMFSFHIFFYLLLQKVEDFCLFYAPAFMIFYSGSCRIVCNVFISDIFEMFYVFWCILCILIQSTMVEQLCLNGFALYKYICNKIIVIKKISVSWRHINVILHQIIANSTLCWTFHSSWQKVNIKGPHFSSFVGESTGDR